MDGIVLLAKQPGVTSFTSLHQVKRAIKSTKVGHTGTLDNFAQGLLVVCTGRLTRLAGDITEFDKSYKAVIKFGTETDTLDYEGEVVKTTNLPTNSRLATVLKTFVGTQEQIPPTYSAIHIDGQRASNLARQGIVKELPPRKITVYKADLLETKQTADGHVQACLIDFTVSKGTYIRSLARDIAQKCESSGHLVGLYRTRVGSFKIEDAAFYDELPVFTIENVLKIAEEQKSKIEIKKEQIKSKIKTDKPVFDEEMDKIIYGKILEKMQAVTPSIALQCGFNILNLVSVQAYEDYMNGRPLKNRLFVEDLYQIPNNTVNAVFAPENQFAGLITKDDTGKIRYKLVVN